MRGIQRMCRESIEVADFIESYVSSALIHDHVVHIALKMLKKHKLYRFETDVQEIIEEDYHGDHEIIHMARETLEVLKKSKES